MVMERCNGGTLTEFINYNHHLPELVTIKLLKDLVHGLQALDALNIVHR
jgi:serine/threonine protein kinase